MKTRVVLSAVLPVVVLAGGALGSDAVLDWNGVTMQVVRNVGGGPPMTSRAYGMVNAAIYDAVNAIDGGHKNFMVNAFGQAGAANSGGTASKDAAAINSAYTVLSNLFPSQQAYLDEQKTASLAALGGGTSVTQGLNIGASVGSQVYNLRLTDGAASANTPFAGGTNPGEWRPTPPGFAPAIGASFGSTRTWVIQNLAQFRPPPPPALTSQQYTNAFNEVKQKGALNNSTRTQDETNIAVFWANDRDGTYKPMGQYLDIARVVATQRGNTIVENARLFGMAAVAMADAGVSCWEAKYRYNFWRPVTAITDTQDDGNPLTITDPTWRPLADQLPVPMTPPFPAYASGHATFGAAVMRMLANFYGTDLIGFTCTTDENVQARSFSSFSQAALENALSRVYLGVHWSFDATAGIDSGNAIADFVFANAFQVPTPGGAALGGLALLFILPRRRR